MWIDSIIPRKQVQRMDGDFETQALDSTLQSPSETLLSIQLLDFKSSLFEAVEELRIRRETEINYEDQISKIVVEKQELEWQKETLQHQMDTLQQQNKEAMAVLKKQLQARMMAMEEEKGKYQLAVETKEKEIDGLKEALKALQISKYTLQKKLNEMDQKLQMHLTTKEQHRKKLNEVEKCYAAIACQFGIIKGVHGKLEHNVQEAMQLNKKLTSVNKKQETEISNLKEELKKVTTDLIRSKVTSQYRVAEENINLAAKEKQFQELQQKIKMETEVSKNIQEENTHIKEEKLTLERDNELQREKAKENEEKFLNLQNEHQKALRTWKKDEENMRREIDSIKNELNSLKGVHRHLEDSHPPKGDQHSEQVDNLQVHSAVQPVPRYVSGQEHSKDSEIQAIQNENECMQSVIRKDSNFGHEETEVKITKDSSLSTKELQIEQNLQVLENSFTDEINAASPHEEEQREASPRNTLCTDKDLITQGQALEIHVTEHKEAENLGATCRMFLDENSAHLEQKLQDSTKPCHMQTRKVILDSVDAVGAFKKNGSQETDSSKQELFITTDESICTKFVPNAVQDNKSTLTPEAPETESEAVLCIRNAVYERSTDNHQAKELSFGISPSIKENSQTEFQKSRLLDSDNHVGNGLHQTEKILLNPSGLHINKFPFKQTHVDAEDKNYEDNTRHKTKNGILRSPDVPAADAQNVPTVYCDNVSGDDATKEHSNNMSVLSTFNLCLPKIERAINVDDMCSKQPEQDSTEQTGNTAHTCTVNAEAISPVKADGLEIIAHKQNSAVTIVSTDKLIPLKKLNDDIQICSIKNGHSLEINNPTNNTLLKEKKLLLTGTVPGRKFAEGHLKESCSLPMRTSGNLVNISGRSSFDLSASDKKAEKTPVYVNFLDLSSCSRVNQIRGQAAWTSASKEPFLLKEKLPGLVENTNVTSQTQCQNPGENVDRRETGSGSTSFNRAANTLNTSSIHGAPQGDPGEDWNAVAKTFYDSSFPTEHVKGGFTASQHEKSPQVIVAPAGNALGEKDSCSSHNSITQNEIEEIEKFSILEQVHSARKRKYEGGQ
ncbi:coiled-coil domain-containing protein 73 isoform X2 [Neopsephotus bourkii]|uniref:coiled-coil domain-containing protein 73 isoform X2 n=1 Tax=Neopsephotus bourkii TaxID=309878 RepID=UPI002AA4FC2D|nr:coiled-coil domain-containing protein 73 isoform X2 [Neopsephotus bourkii]